MIDEKEIKRIMEIARGHAAAALAKPETQRDSHLAFCRLNWKRYAAGITRSTAEGERFADALERATRDLMALMQTGAGSTSSEETHATPDPTTGSGDDLAWAAHDLGYDLPTLLPEDASPDAESERAEEDPARSGDVETEDPESDRVRYSGDSILQALKSPKGDPLLNGPAATQQPAIQKDVEPALAEMRPKIREILGRKLLGGD